MANIWIALEFISKKELKLAEKFLGYRISDGFVILHNKKAGKLSEYLKARGVEIRREDGGKLTP